MVRKSANYHSQGYAENTSIYDETVRNMNKKNAIKKCNIRTPVIRIPKLFGIRVTRFAGNQLDTRKAFVQI